MSENKYDIERISTEIQLYLQNHPNAADTLEGITRWWIKRQRYEEGEENVQKALDLLLNRKLLTRIMNLDGTNVYKSILGGSFH